MQEFDANAMLCIFFWSEGCDSHLWSQLFHCTYHSTLFAHGDAIMCMHAFMYTSIGSDLQSSSLLILSIIAYSFTMADSVADVAKLIRKHMADAQATGANITAWEMIQELLVSKNFAYKTKAPVQFVGVSPGNRAMYDQP